MGDAREVAMYKHILVAVDGSRSAQRAVDEAVKIARATGGKILALSVALYPARLVDTASGFAEAQTHETTAQDLTTAALDDAKARCDAAQVPATLRAADSHGEEVAVVISRIAAEEGADLIVMGTRGLSGVKRLLLGSVAESLLRAADRPVMLVRYEEPRT
jgi:nucleotide-binding universal stress UspA family protein